VIIDSSAIVAILRKEPEGPAFAEVIEKAFSCRMSAANFLETAIVIDTMREPLVTHRFDDMLMQSRIAIEPVTAEQARIAREAFRDFGRGSGHPARLNFGDCFAYALARVTGEPLLFKGNDFSHTDLRSALA